jgi:hypothetical protein
MRSRPVLGALCVVLFCVGCGWFTSGGGTKVVDAGVCIAEDALAGKDVATIARDCAVDVAQVISSLLTSQDPKVHATPAAAESRRARAAMGIDGGS